MHWFYIVLIGLVAGWLAGLVMRGRGFGMIGDIVIGILGALVGGAVFNALGVNKMGVTGSLVAAFIGAVILVFLIKLFKKV